MNLKVCLVIAGAVLLLAGCGDSGSSATGEGESDKEAYIEAADELCRQVAEDLYATNLRIQVLSENTDGKEVLSGSAEARELIRLKAKLRRAEAELTDDLRSLEPPAEGAADVYLGLREELEQTYLDGQPAATRFFRNPNPETMKPIQELSARLLVLFQELHEASTVYGFEECALLHPDAGSVL